MAIPPRAREEGLFHPGQHHHHAQCNQRRTLQLSDLGVKLNKDGTFSLDTATLATALSNNASAVAAMFTSGVNGVYSTFFAW
jgi:flagellar capping protein FliD